MPKNKHLDPGLEQFYRKYPKFPGMAKCVDLLSHRNVRGFYLEAVLYVIRIHAEEHLEELIAEIRNADSHVAASLLDALGEIRLPATEEIFTEYLRSNDYSCRYWAIRGLKALDSRSARKTLWYAREYAFKTPEETEEFRRIIDREMGWDT